MGFEEFLPNRANCSHLNARVPELGVQKKYILRCKTRYADVFKDDGGRAHLEWAIRCHKSLKEAVTSAAFYEESLIAKDGFSWTGFFFLSYYSLFHALLACIYLLPEESIENLSQVNHSKLINIFVAHFCKRPELVRADVGEVFQLLKFQREYYSYRMPPNDFLYEHPESLKPDEILPYYLRACYQLASMLSEIVENSATKHAAHSLDRAASAVLVRNLYCMTHTRPHPKTGAPILHYVDEVQMREIIDHPRPVSLSTMFEHFEDEFRTYEGGNMPRKRDGTPIMPTSFVWRAIT